MSPERLRQLAAQAEQAGLNAAASPHQADVDGWLLRLSPGQAKRSRCVNALAAGTLPLADMLARCRRSFDAAGLPLILRLTPFSQPADLDAQLAAMGWTEFDPADVMVLDEPARFLVAGHLPIPEGTDLVPLSPADYAALIGGLRGSSAVEIQAHAERLVQAPVPHQAFMLQRSKDQSLLACGQVAVDVSLRPAADAGPMAGLFDIFTPEARRGQGQGAALCAALLALAARQGARSAYLQVGAANEAAKRLYARLGFAWAYRYAYRSDDDRAWR